MRPKHKTKTITQEQAGRHGMCLNRFPSAGPYPNITGMKKLYWGMDAYCLKLGAYVYHVDYETYSKV
jgi:hypothetical protein